MSSSDGYISGTHKIVDHGPNSQRYNVVILGDGYRASELPKFVEDVDDFVETMRSTAPFDDLWCAVNLHRIDVVSTDSGADDPGTCGDGSTGTGATPKTYFDSTFCGDGQVRRLLTCDSASALSVAQARVSKVHIAMVIVNTSIYGGSGGQVATFSTAANASEIGLHELGHSAFGLADEYEYLQGCGSGESGHDSYSAGEPGEPNVTVNTNAATIKWGDLLTNSADSLPTTANANCAECDSQANPKAASYVGAYEGAQYFHCGLYRPQYDCRMRALSNPFCAVCRDVIEDVLTPLKPPESLTLTTPSINFANVPEGLGGIGVTTYRAIVFEVITCAQRTFEIISGPSGGFGTPLGAVITVSAADADPMAEARLWLSYTSTTAGSSSSGSVTVRCPETGETWVINITANTVARPKSAVTLVLDRSGSMSEESGDGTSKIDKLREAATIFTNAMLQGDGLGLVRFDDTAQILMPVTDVGPPVIGSGRVTAIGHISGSGIDPAGSTSIGGGVVSGKQALDDAQASASPPYDVTAMLVLTDGMENTPPMLASVGGSITANTFAIGLGEPQNISVAALNQLTQGHNGYLLVTGTLTSDQAARLNKYFLQILAGITNANVVLDPHGDLTPGATHRIPFMVSDAEFGIDVFLLSPYSSYVNFQLETPGGELLDPGSVGGPGNVNFVQVDNLSYYRLSLPALPEDESGTHDGTWHAVLNVPGRKQKMAAVGLAGTSRREWLLPYEVVVHCYSNLFLRADARQSGFEPGATVSLSASLQEYDVPVENRARAWVQVTRPDASSFNLSLPEDDAGRFEGSFVASQSGLYAMRVRAVGSTFKGVAFEREQTLSAAVYPGGDRVEPPGSGGSEIWCMVLECLLADRALMSQLIEKGWDIRGVARCVARRCAALKPPREGRPEPSRRLDEEEIRRLVVRVIDELD